MERSNRKNTCLFMLTERHLFLILLFYLSLGSGNSNTAEDKKLNINFVILSQSTVHHARLAEVKKVDILTQMKTSISKEKVLFNVYKTHEDFKNVSGHWTIYPLFKELSKLASNSWTFFLDDTTSIDVEKLIDVLFSYDSSHEIFAGFALKDKDPTIIHHFEPADGESVLFYPHFTTGFFLSFPLIQRLSSGCKDCRDFSIDPKYELSLFIYKESGVRLTHESRLCLKKSSNCATWVQEDFPYCGEPYPSEKVLVAVKTCKMFHKDRVKVVKETWAKDVTNITIFSDVTDSSIPTVSVGVKNVKSGHCKKTMVIMQYILQKYPSADWLVIVDDDTLLSYKRILRLLTCYDALKPIALGERYGYGVTSSEGYDYLTGGSGMIFSLQTVKKLTQFCKCPAIDSPDDMILGLCLKHLGISITHLPHFHQARPVDYAADFLRPLKHVSFHKHWMIDPYEVYENWLKEEDQTVHSEL